MSQKPLLFTKKEVMYKVVIIDFFWLIRLDAHMATAVEILIRFVYLLQAMYMHLSTSLYPILFCSATINVSGTCS